MSEALPITTRIGLVQTDGNGENHAMTDYRQNRVPGGTYFFTVNLADRRGDLLVRPLPPESRWEAMTFERFKRAAEILL